MRVPLKSETHGLKSCSNPAPLYTTAGKTGALTVAGQWRSFTAFPNILAIAMMSCAAARGGSNDVMETTSMTSTFIAGSWCEVKEENRAAKKGMRRVESSCG
jgi:hypothetical protein